MSGASVTVTSAEVADVLPRQAVVLLPAVASEMEPTPPLTENRAAGLTVQGPVSAVPKPPVTVRLKVSVAKGPPTRLVGETVCVTVPVAPPFR